MTESTFSYLGNCAMRNKLATEIRNFLWDKDCLESFTSIDILRADFKANIAPLTTAATKYGVEAFLFGVPHNSVGNRRIDGVTGGHGTNNASAVVVCVLHDDGSVFKSNDHPMLLEKRLHSFLFPDHADQLTEWINRFAEYGADGSDTIDDEWEVIDRPSSPLFE